MPAQYVIDRALRTVLTKFSGVLTLGEVVELVRKLSSDPDFDRTFAEIVNLSEATDVQLDYLDFQRLKGIDPFSEGSRRAFVIPSRNVAYGVTRMFQALREGEAHIEIFDTTEEARRWVSEQS
jgi:hypothetical protein